MIIKAKFEKDKFEFTHAQDMKPVMEYADILRKNGTNNGYSKDRNYRHIGEIPTLLYHEYLQKYPELLMGEPKDKHRILKKILTEHPEFKISEGGI